MRDIKFRGRVLDSNKIDGGKIVCGMLSICTLKDKTHWIYPLDGGWGFEVDPDSVAQLIGYDSNGAEVYEGDIVVDELTQEYTAEIYDRPEKIAQLKLKEAQHAV